MRSFAGDRRGVTIQVGAILLFGIAIIALSTYQAVAVPIENEQVEFNHNQAVQQDMVELRSALLRAGTDDGSQSVSVSLGTTYPSRLLLVNPPPPSGRLATEPARNATFGNLTATDNETDDFLNTTTNGPYNLSTRSVTYTPSYSEYRNAPTTTFESGTTVNENPRGNDTVLGGQTVVRGTELYLVTVTGDLSVARSGTVAVDPESLSTSSRATTVTDTSAGNLTLTVPTTLSAERWETLLGEEYDEGFDDSGHVYNVSAVPGRDAVRLSLDGGVTYRLRTARVGVGSTGDAPGPAYVTAVDGDDDVTIEVRDRFNNPVPNSRVTDDLFVNATGGNQSYLSPDTQNVSVGEDGQAEFTLNGSKTSDDAPATVNFTLKTEAGVTVIPDQPGSVSVLVEESDLPAAGGEGGGGGSSAVSIDSFSTKDANNKPNKFDPEATATVSDSDGDADLSELRFVLRNSTGSNLETDTFSVSGGSTTETATFDDFGTRNTDETYNIRVTVVDADGNNDIQTKSLS